MADIFFRCKFQLKKMILEQQLELVSVNWMMVKKNQRYVQWSLVNMNVFTEGETCLDHPVINENAIICPGEECQPWSLKDPDALEVCLAAVKRGKIVLAS